MCTHGEGYAPQLNELKQNLFFCILTVKEMRGECWACRMQLWAQRVAGWFLGHHWPLLLAEGIAARAQPPP